jgi:hypothetical protein
MSIETPSPPSIQHSMQLGPVMEGKLVFCRLHVLSRLMYDQACNLALSALHKLDRQVGVFQKELVFDSAANASLSWSVPCAARWPSSNVITTSKFGASA